jgi:crotonobetainyl-CoA:carnitine CoA-transferase CaiB-like acyl-CoA transferase
VGDAAGTVGRPLDGIRVVDLTLDLGELCGRILADLGAEVVRVEPPGGTPSRSRPPLAPDGTSLWFAHRAMGERSVTADLTTALGRATVETLLGGADVLVESAGPGGWTAVDPTLDPQVVAARHAHLVVASISHFGWDGPRASWLGTDLVDAAAGGFVWRFGPRHRPPLAPPGTMASDVAGLATAVAALAALHQRLATGRGQWFEVSAVEAMTGISDWALAMFSQTGRDQARDGAGTLYPIYRCADGHLRMVSPITSREWAPLVEWLGHPEALAADDWAQPAVRMGRLAELRDLLAAWFADKPRDATVADGVARGLAVAPVLRPSDVLEHPHFASRATFTPVEVAPGTTVQAFDGFLSVDGARVGLRGAPPHPGQDDGAIDWAPRPAPTPAPPGTPPRPFAGLRVLDLGIGGVGVECGRVMAELGADVVKVETIAHPDFQRVVLGGLMNGCFASSSRTKRGLAVDLDRPEGVELLLRLAEHADVVIENRSTGALDRLGVGWTALSAVNPRLVMVSSQLMGDRGAWASWKGYGPITRAVSGLAWLWNHPEDVDDPQGVTTIHPDHAAGRWMAVAVGALLLRRARTGLGGHADVAQVEVIVGQLGDVLAAESVSPGSTVPVGNRGPDAPWGVYPCAPLDVDGGAEGSVTEDWVAISVRGDADWAALVAALRDPGAGHPAWVDDPAFATTAGRLAARDELDAHLAAWTAGRPADAVAELLQAAGVPAARLLHPRVFADDPQLRARGALLALDQPGIGPIVVEGPAWRGPSLGSPIITPAPFPGEHSREVVAEWLGLDADAVDALVASGALEVHEPAPAPA